MAKLFKKINILYIVRMTDMDEIKQKNIYENKYVRFIQAKQRTTLTFMKRRVKELQNIKKQI